MPLHMVEQNKVDLGRLSSLLSAENTGRHIPSWKSFHKLQPYLSNMSAWLLANFLKVLRSSRYRLINHKTHCNYCILYLYVQVGKIYIPYVGLDGMLEPMSGKLTMLNLNLSLLSYNVVEYFPCSIVISISKYERAVVLSVVFLS